VILPTKSLPLNHYQQGIVLAALDILLTYLDHKYDYDPETDQSNAPDGNADINGADLIDDLGTAIYNRYIDGPTFDMRVKADDMFEMLVGIYAQRG
jgi:hypothetical protein